MRTALGDKASWANNALALSDQIGPILASGTKGNPRQISASSTPSSCANARLRPAGSATM